MFEHRQSSLDQEPYVDLRQIVATGLATPWGVVGQEGSIGKPEMAYKIGIVLLGRAKSVQKQDRRLCPVPPDCGNVQSRFRNLETVSRYG